jgi:hypothetical protein
MDARGFGRTARDGHRTAGLVISVVSLTALIVGGTGLLGGWTPTWLWTGFLVVGVGGLVVALHLRAAVVLRTSFDTQPFTVRSVVVSALGVAVSVGLLVAGNLCPRLLDAPAPETMPTVSTLSLLAVLGIVAAGILAPKATS